jgi:hypothetical protein
MKVILAVEYHVIQVAVKVTCVFSVTALSSVCPPRAVPYQNVGTDANFSTRELSLILLYVVVNLVATFCAHLAGFCFSTVRN